jgi:hypothetical protein
MEHIRSQFTSLVSSLQGEVGKLQEERKTLAKEIDVLSHEYEKLNVAPYKITDVRVQLDVGGLLYATTVETLTKVSDSMLGKMFSGRFPLRFTEEGRVFIDRDGTHFRHILNYLRDPENWKFTSKDKQLIDELRSEARYYGVEDPMFKKNNRQPKRQGWLDGKVRVSGFSSQYESCPATNILDPQKTYWLSETGKIEDQWVTFEFDKEVYVSKLSIKVDKFECTVKDFIVQISEGDDKISWIDVMPYQAICGKECNTEQFFDGFEVRAKYIRLFFRNRWGKGGGEYILVTNVRFFGAELDSF